jgi:hypothetical protein
VPEALPAEPADVVVERVDPDPERQVALELGSAPAEHQVTRLLAERGELVEQARLADSRLAAEGDESGRRTAQAGQRRLQCRELVAAADE